MSFKHIFDGHSGECRKVFLIASGFGRFVRTIGSTGE